MALPLGRGGVALANKPALRPSPSALLLPLLLGCNSPDRLLPLKVGQRWDYRFKTANQRETGSIEVMREVPVANGVGWELKGPYGVSRLGYAGDRLVAEQLGGAFLQPALPIGLPAKGEALWRGWVVGLSGKRAAKATIVADEDRLLVRGRKTKLSRTTVTMRVDGHTVVLATWFAPGDGIVQQNQETDGKLDLSLERLAGG